MSEPMFELPPDTPGVVNDLRQAWFARRRVRVSLTEPCCIPFVVGRVTSVSVTGGTAAVDGWEIPVQYVTGVERATREDVEVYAHAMQAMREQAEVCGFCHGLPVRNAAAWLSPDAPEYAPCPRCGRTNLPTGVS